MKRVVLPGICILTLVQCSLPRGGIVQAQSVDAFRLQQQRESRIAAAGVVLLSVGTLIQLCQVGPDPATLDKNGIFAPDRFAVDMHVPGTGNISDMTAGFCLGLPLLTALGAGEKRYAAQDLVMSFESILLTQGVIELSKSLFQRPRPYAYRATGDGRLSKNAGRSFISGHTAAAFQGAVIAAVLFSERHPRSPLRAPVWAAGLSCAAATAVLRVLSGNHFPTDVIAGAAAGSVIGWLVPRLHREGIIAGPAVGGTGMVGIQITL